MISFVFVACATKHPGTIAKINTSDSDQSIKLVVSAKVIRDYSDPYNSYIDLAFENKSGHWLRVDEVELDFTNSGDVPHNVIIGQDLYAWAESFEEKKKIENHNTALAINSLILAGAILSHSKNANTQALGASALAGGVGWDATRTFMKNLNYAERSKSVPEKHIYRAFTVPAAGLIRRWFIVNTPTDQIVKNFNMKILTVDGKTLNYTVPIKL